MWPSCICLNVWADMCTYISILRCIIFAELAGSQCLFSPYISMYCEGGCTCIYMYIYLPTRVCACVYMLESWAGPENEARWSGTRLLDITITVFRVTLLKTPTS